MSLPPFLTWRDFDNKAPTYGQLEGPFWPYFASKKGPELIVHFSARIDSVTHAAPRPLAIGMQGMIRLEKQFGKNMLLWPGQAVALRRGHHGPHPYIEIVERGR